MCFDTETSGLDPHVDKIGLLILETKGNLYLLQKLPSWFEYILLDPSIVKIAFNIRFDLAFLFKHYGIFHARNVRCLYLEELLISTQRRDVPHNLQAVLHRRLGVDISKGHNDAEQELMDAEIAALAEDIDLLDLTKGKKVALLTKCSKEIVARYKVPYAARVDWFGDLSDEMIDYALGDIIYLHHLADFMTEKLTETGQERAADIENAAVPVVAMMSLNGIGVDRPKWEESIVDWAGKAQQSREQLDELCGDQIVNWNSTKQIREVVESIYGIALPNTKHPTLIDFQEEMPLLQRLLEYRHWEKRATNWGEEFLAANIHPDTGRIYPSWWQLGTGTGRFSCSSPNLQQIPHDAATRALFVAKEGHLLASLDYKAIEMLVAAVIAKDTEFLRVCQDADPHTIVAQLVLGAGSTVSSDERQLAKAVGFGLLFGGGVDGFIAYARNNYGVTIESERAAQVVKSFFQRFPGLRAMRSKAYSYFRGSDGSERRPGALEVRTLVGSRRILEGLSCKPTTWLNTQIQGTAGYGIKAGMVRLAEAGLSQYLCLQVHDELVAEFPEKDIEEYVLRAKNCMIKGMQDVVGPVKIGIETKAGKQWQK